MVEIPGFAYDLDALIAALPSIEANIKSLEVGLQAQREKLANYHKLIVEAKTIIRMHKDGMK